MKFVSALVFTAMAFSVSAHASAPSGGDITCPHQLADAQAKKDGLQVVELVEGKGKAPPKTQSAPAQKGTATRGG